ncbi:MAG: hypothetical protein ACRDPY_50855 [Streptosporangiaceae bacterium]
MEDTKNSEAGPVEVWLTQKNLVVTCQVVREDETTITLEVGSLSMRGAQREVTGYFIAEGYVSAGRWQWEGKEPGQEAVRQFKPGPEARPGALAETEPGEAEETGKDLSLYLTKPFSPTMTDFIEWLTEQYGDLAKIDQERVAVISVLVYQYFQRSSFNHERKAARRAERVSASK